ncbi:nucleoside phosphorylase [Lapidilactobacillus bayanensis]|uniref:nucleoside phosphorylase n=1 Tax=Lapidilactobacillus bayanensis TaxID=2485998 RepID=UPI000F7B569C|nr:nucleoside phosphorylase [Lapidilactobacillus bayanensis]
MFEEPFFLNFDRDPHAVLEPNHERAPFKFHSKLLYAFVSKDKIDLFLSQHAHKILGTFESISFCPDVYEVEIGHEKLTLCQAPLGAPAATQLLDWLIAYGVENVLAFGTAGALEDLPENTMLVPTRAIRDEGTSFHYVEPGRLINLESAFLTRIEKEIVNLGMTSDEIITWTTDGFFRETSEKVTQFRKLGAATVEMECAALAACAQFRNVDFAQILFTADSLANLEDYDERNWGDDSHQFGLEICSQILANI